MKGTTKHHIKILEDKFVPLMMIINLRLLRSQLPDASVIACWNLRRLWRGLNAMVAQAAPCTDLFAVKDDLELGGDADKYIAEVQL